MKLLCASNNLAFVHSLRIALDGEGIEHYFSDADTVMSGIAGPMTGSAGRLYILHDEDWARAVELFQMLDGPAPPPSESARPTKPPSVWWVLGIAALMAATLAGVLGGSR